MTSSKPSWLDFNSSTGVLSGTPDQNSTDATITLSVENPHSTIYQTHKIKVYNPDLFTVRLELEPVGLISGDNPNNLSGLILHLDASKFLEENGTTIKNWSDLSGFEHSLDRSRGNPTLLSNSLSNGLKVVSFNGLSQLYSSFDFSSSLGDYSVLAIARYSGTEKGNVISSVGTNWVFGLGEGSTSFLRMGNVVVPPVSSDNEWHIYAGSFSADGNVEFWRDQIKNW